jgi:hypothetical protein
VLVAVAVLAATVVARFATTNAHADVLVVLQGSVGAKTVTVDLLAGRWKVYSAAGKGAISSFTVTQ